MGFTVLGKLKNLCWNIGLGKQSSTRRLLNAQKEAGKMDEDIFREVSDEEVPKVLQALKKDWPQHFLLYQTVSIVKQYKDSGSQWKYSLFLHGDYDTGVYLYKVTIQYPTMTRNDLYVYSLSSDVSAVTKCLQETRVVPWHKKELCFQMTHNRFRSSIEEAFTSKKIKYCLDDNTMFWYPPDKELNTKPLPDDVYLDFLDETYAEEMDRNWPHKFPGSVLRHREHLRYCFGLGLFRREDKRLLCSSLSTYTGGVFLLYSDPEFRGRGFAVLMVLHMAQEIRRRGWIPFCTVIVGNKPSETVFTRAGYEVFSKAEYMWPSD